MKNIVETGKEMGKFNTLIAAVDAAGLTETLSNEGPFQFLHLMMMHLLNYQKEQ